MAKYDEAYERGCDLGHLSALEELYKKYLGYSADYYKQHDDRRAEWFRTLSDNLKTEYQVERNKFDKKYHIKE